MAQTWHERVVELLNIAEAERDALRARVAELEAAARPMTDDELLAEIVRLNDLDDPEMGHINVDALIHEFLGKLGYTKCAEYLNNTSWWYA